MNFKVEKIAQNFFKLAFNTIRREDRKFRRLIINNPQTTGITFCDWDQGYFSLFETTIVYEILKSYINDISLKTYPICYEKKYPGRSHEVLDLGIYKSDKSAKKEYPIDLAIEVKYWKDTNKLKQDANKLLNEFKSNRFNNVALLIISRDSERSDADYLSDGVKEKIHYNYKKRTHTLESNPNRCKSFATYRFNHDTFEQEKAYCNVSLFLKCRK